MPAAPSTTRPSRWRRKHTWLFHLPLCLLLFALLAALLCWHLLRTDPAWYQPPAIDDPAVGQLIDSFQYRKVPEYNNAIQRAPLGDQVLEVYQDELNASIAADLHVAHQGGMGKIGIPVVNFAADHITIAVRASALPGVSPEGGVVTVMYKVEMFDAPADDPDQHRRLRLTLEKAWVGRLRIPTSLVRSRVGDLKEAVEKNLQNLPALAGELDPAKRTNDSAQFHDLLTHGLDGEAFVPTFTLPRKYPMVIKDIAITDGVIRITIGLRDPLPGR